MAINFPLAVVIRGIDKISGPLASIQAKTKKFGKSAKSTGRAMSIGLSAPLLAFGALTAQTATNFEFSMNRVKALIPESTDAGIKKLRELAKELGANTPFSAGQAAEAMQLLAMAGFDVQKIYTAVPGVLDLATATNIDLANATEIAAGTLAGFSKDAGMMVKVADTLAAATTLVKSDMTAFGEAMAKAAPVAGIMGIKIEEVSVALGLMANKNILGSEAGTAFRRSLSRLAKLTPEASKRFKIMGIDIDNIVDRTGNLKTFVGLIKELEAANDGAGATARDLSTVFGERAFAPIAAILASGSEAFVDLEQKMRPAGQAARIAEITMSGAFEAVKKAEAAFEAFQISLADSGLLTWFTEAATKVGGFFTDLSKTNPETLKFATKIALVAAAIGPVVFLIGQTSLALSGMLGFTMLVGGAGLGLGKTFWAVSKAVWAFNVALLANPIGVVIIAIAAIGLAIYALWKDFLGIRSAFVDGFKMITDGAKLFARDVSAAWSGMLMSIGEKWDSLWDWVFGGFVSIGAKIGDFFTALVPDFVKDLFGGDSKATIEVRPGGEPLPTSSGSRAAFGNQEASLSVRFDNMPPGVTVERQRGDLPVDIELGFSNGGA